MATSTATKTTESVTVPARAEINITRNAERRAQVKRFKELKAIISAAQKELGDKKKPGLEAEISEWMENKDDAIVNGVAVLKRSSLRSNSSADLKLLAEAYPDAAAATIRTTYFTFFTAS